MYNVFTHRMQLASSEAESKAKKIREMREVVREQNRDEMRRMSVGRAVTWAQEHMGKEYTQTVRSGGIMLAHPSHHQFRISPKESADNVYVRNYQPADQRAAAAQTDYHAAYLGSDYVYNGNSPHTHTDWIRKPNPAKFLFSPHNTFKTQNDEERLKTSASSQRFITLEGFNAFTVSNPKFRTRSKAQETGLQEFSSFVRSFGKNQSAWATSKIYDGEKYVDGFAVTGDLSKKREKQKEVNTVDFALTSPKDPWRQWTSPRLSIREQKSLEQMKKLDLVPSVPTFRSSAKTSAKSGPGSPVGSQKYYMKTYETQLSLTPLAPNQSISSRLPTQVSHFKPEW